MTIIQPPDLATLSPQRELEQPTYSKPPYEVTSLELFFDLVYAFAISQLSTYLLSDLSWYGAAKTLVLQLTVVTAWAFTSWVATHAHVESLSARGMVMAVTLFGLFMNAAIPTAFSTGAWAFVVPMLVIRLGRTVWCIATLDDPRARVHYLRMLVWRLLTMPLWIGGALADADTRLYWWAAGTGIDLIGTWLAHPLPGGQLVSSRFQFDGDHLLERCRLFIMIALGETVLTTGAAITSSHVSLMTIMTGTAALVGNIALWAMLFGAADRRVSAHMQITSDPVRASRHAMNSMTVVVSGLIAVAVANKMIIMAPHSPPSVALSLLLFGGPVLMLGSIGWYSGVVLRRSPRYNLFGAISLLSAGLLSYALPHLLQLIIASSVLVMIAWHDRD